MILFLTSSDSNVGSEYNFEDADVKLSCGSESIMRARIILQQVMSCQSCQHKRTKDLWINSCCDSGTRSGNLRLRSGKIVRDNIWKRLGVVHEGAIFRSPLSNTKKKRKRNKTSRKHIQLMLSQQPKTFLKSHNCAERLFGVFFIEPCT